LSKCKKGTEHNFEMLDGGRFFQESWAMENMALKSIFLFQSGQNYE
jgi:hypothetical protein